MNIEDLLRAEIRVARADVAELLRRVRELKAENIALGVAAELTKEELAQSHYYRECRDYWRDQAESLAEMVDQHNRQVHQAMSHEQLFQPPREAE